MRKLTKKLNNNTFVGSDVNGMEGGGRRFKGFKASMRKAGRRMKSGIITGARGIRSRSKTVGSSLKRAGRSFKSGLSWARQKIHKPFKNQSLAKKKSRVQKRTKKLEKKTESYNTKINDIDKKSGIYKKSIKTLEEMLKNKPNNPYAEKRLRETSNKLKNLQKSRNQITAKLTTRKAELNTSKGKLNSYTKELEKTATKKTNKAMSNYEKFHTKGPWKQKFLKFATKAGRRSRAINKSLKKGNLTGEKMISDYQKYKKERGDLNKQTGEYKNPYAKMNSQKTIREILAARKAKQMSFTFGQRRRTKDLVEYLKKGKNTTLEESVTKAKQGANNLIKNSELRSNINKSYSEKAKLLSKQSKNKETGTELVKTTNKTADEKRKIKRAYNRDIKRGNSNKISNLERKLHDRKTKQKFFESKGWDKSKYIKYKTLDDKKNKTPEEMSEFLTLSQARQKLRNELNIKMQKGKERRERKEKNILNAISNTNTLTGKLFNQ